MNKTVYVVTDPELGWDCVIAVYDSDNLAKKELRDKLEPRGYIVHEVNLESTLDNYE